MKRPSRSPAHVPLALAVTGLTLVAAACGDDDGDDDVAAAEATDAATADGRRRRRHPPQLPDTITIGYQNVPNGDLDRQARGLARAGLRRRRHDRVEAVRLRRLRQRGRARRRRRHRPRRIEPGLARHLVGDRVQRAVDLRRDRQGRGARRHGRQRDHLARRSQGQDDRHAVRLDQSLQPAGGARRCRRRRVRRQHHRQRARRDLRRLAAGRHRRRLRLEPEPRQARRRGRHGAGHQRGSRQEGQDHLRPGDRDQRVRRQAYPAAVQIWIDQQNAAIADDQERPGRRGRGGRRRAQHHARGSQAAALRVDLPRRVRAGRHRLPRRWSRRQPVRRRPVQPRRSVRSRACSPRPTTSRQW